MKNKDLYLLGGVIVGLMLLKRKSVSGIYGVSYDVVFHDNDSSNAKGFEESLQYCKNYIKNYNGTNESYFKDYKGGFVQIVNNATGEVVKTYNVK
jgi:hypothetical protein